MRGKRSLGVVYTPDELVRFMLSLVRRPVTPEWRVLEPACASAPFLRAFTERYGPVAELVGVELDPEGARGFAVPGARLVHADFLLWEPPERFDLILGNPPYGIIGAPGHYAMHALREAKRAYRARFQTWYGRYNVYGAFIEHAVNLLKPGGELIYVVPASWMILEEFKRLREFLAAHGTLEVHYLGRAFPGVRVTAVVLHFVKARPGGLRLFDGDRLWLERQDYRGEWIRFETPETRAFEAANPVPLAAVFEVRFAARSPEFRDRPFVHPAPGPGRLPVLTGRNLKRGWIDYETNHSGLWVERERVGELKPFYRVPRVVVGHTKTRGAIVAAVDARGYPWREEFHLVPRHPVDLEAVAAHLNSPEMQRYVATLYRDLTKHLNRNQLCRLPLPERFAVPALLAPAGPGA